jgi:hypothetical protein
MSDVLDLLGDALTPDALTALAKQLGIGPDDVVKLVKAVLPELLHRLQTNADGGDAANIAAAVAADHDGGVLDTATSFLGGGFLSGAGAGILDHVFGNELDQSVQQVSTTTHLPPAVVQTAMKALAPMVMGALAKAAIGAITGAGVIALLAVAVQGVRSGKVQRLLGGVNARLDDDHDGNALDDVGRDALGAAKKGGKAVASAATKVAENDKVKAAAAKASSTAKEVAGKAKDAAGKAASSAKKKLKKLFGRWG